MEKAKAGSPLTEEEIDVFVFDSIIAQNAYPTPIGFMKFPKSVCLSVNECFVHGIPSLRTLEEGDKLNIDVSIYSEGYHGDNNLTLFYGTPSHPIKQTIVDAHLVRSYLNLRSRSTLPRNRQNNSEHCHQK